MVARHRLLPAAWPELPKLFFHDRPLCCTALFVVPLTCDPPHPPKRLRLAGHLPPAPATHVSYDFGPYPLRRRRSWRQLLAYLPGRRRHVGHRLLDPACFSAFFLNFTYDPKPGAIRATHHSSIRASVTPATPVVSGVSVTLATPSYLKLPAVGRGSGSGVRWPPRDPHVRSRSTMHATMATATVVSKKGGEQCPIDRWDLLSGFTVRVAQAKDLLANGAGSEWAVRRKQSESEREGATSQPLMHTL
ncbi:hypothetical protein CMQ_6765 [Grosmannia clavigera kw1407]|uniref:Uncharacterized protein n=1 Tax=Grosmannia clavigera (strain kw1407 / UAMH 11150) TaxID=655863 RepID=F0X7H2_GROCL|nr:uncharacterized protein CMQ_6765 [Grosmannia clavigera kw1407]EFX06444.1 hypothetical protein CMQ_6765 [Grosmannia clavigera kw1407]